MIQPGIHCEISLIDISSTVCELTMLILSMFVTFSVTLCLLHLQLEINMHHLPKAMQCRQAPWAILRKFCVVVGFL